MENAECNVAQVDFISISDISSNSDLEIDFENTDNLWSENLQNVNTKEFIDTSGPTQSLPS